MAKIVLFVLVLSTQVKPLADVKSPIMQEIVTEKLLSLVISVYNEEDNILPLTQQIHQALEGYRYEIIFADDGSSDETVARVLEMNDPKVHLIELRKNYGQSSALAAGIDYAHGAWIITLDGDLQNDPSDIPQMVAKAEKEHWDVVTGIRAKRKDKFFLRKIPSWLGNALVRKATGIHIKDNGCALKVFRADIAKELGLYGELHRFIAVLAHLEGARIAQVDVKHHPRIHGKSKYGLSRTLKVVSDLMLMLFFKKYMQRPMHLFGTWGFLIFGLGALINIYLLVLKVMGQDIWGKPLLLLGILLLLAGIQLITFGLLADSQMRTYYESQEKKPYRIKRISQGGKEN